MTGREKIEAAFSKEGTVEIAAVIPYENIYVRDHWRELTRCPWWYRESPAIEHQMLWRREAIRKTGQDWFSLPAGHSWDDRRSISIEARSDGVYRFDRRTGRTEQLHQPPIGGEVYYPPLHPAETPREIESFFHDASVFDAEAAVTNGRADLAARLLEEFGSDLCPVRNMGSPLWNCYGLWGFEGMMVMIATRPDLVRYACQRFLSLGIRTVREAAALGVEGIWIEDCLMDLISPEAYESLNMPSLRQLVEEVRVSGLRSIYYFCGNPSGKWDLILSVGADAIALEESKKNFTIDIEDVADKVQGHCTVMGNLDAVGILQDGTEERLKTEISRQIAAGRRNSGRFIMSLGSPVTPETPVGKVRLYCDLVHELGVM